MFIIDKQMGKQNNLQLELFSSQHDSSINTSHTDNAPLWSLMRHYEKTILTIIGVVIICLISFSLGVERGKHLAMPLQQPMRDPEVVPKTTNQDSVIQKKEETQQTAPQQKENQLRYTIQLASYKTKTFAQREADALKGKGLSPLILKKGDYIVLCVGMFENKENARPLLPELSKRYKGCYIRRL